MWTLWDKPVKFKPGSPSLRLFRANLRTAYRTQKNDISLHSLGPAEGETKQERTHSLWDRTVFLDGLCPPLCRWAIFDPPEMICSLQRLWLFSAKQKKPNLLQHVGPSYHWYDVEFKKLGSCIYAELFGKLAFYSNLVVDTLPKHQLCSEIFQEKQLFMESLQVWKWSFVFIPLWLFTYLYHLFYPFVLL